MLELRQLTVNLLIVWTRVLLLVFCLLTLVFEKALVAIVLSCILASLVRRVLLARDHNDFGLRLREAQRVWFALGMVAAAGSLLELKNSVLQFLPLAVPLLLKHLVHGKQLEHVLAEQRQGGREHVEGALDLLQILGEARLERLQERGGVGDHGSCGRGHASSKE